MNKETKYYNNPAISQSRLKKMLSHPKSYLENRQIKGAALSMGSLVDCLILTPEDFKSSYFITKEFKVPESIKEIWNFYFENRKVLGNFDIEDDLILSVAKEFNYRAKNKDEVILKFVKEHKYYYDYLIESKDKIIITDSDLKLAESIKESLLNNPFTSKYFEDSTHNQLQIYWELEEFPNLKFKSLLDRCIIDEENKTIQPIDLKTTGEYTNKFKKSIYKFRYDFQAAFYTFALKKAFPDYTIFPFIFIVESTKIVGSPMIYKMSEYALKVGAFGGMVDNVEYKGFIQCLENLMWHIKNNLWEYTKELYESKATVIV